jgi:hypothetical protein
MQDLLQEKVCVPSNSTGTTHHIGGLIINEYQDNIELLHSYCLSLR